MFFIASKLFWSVANPLNLTAILSAIGLGLLLVGWRRLATAAVAASFLVLFVSGWTSLGVMLLQPLEKRFARPASLPEHITGIVVLGGAFEGGINRVRGGYELNAAADRFVETAILARRFPEAKVLVTGGVGALFLEGEADADSAPRLLVALGVSPERLILENQSRNTYENAVFSKRMADPQPGETWLLVTSAFHMPRSMGLFREVGFPVLPWPVDYRTAGDEEFGLARDNGFDTLQSTAIALREWTGLFAYWFVGRIDEILPAPSP